MPSSEIRARLTALKSRWDSGPIPVGLRRQTFYDDVIVATKKGRIERLYGRVTKLNGGQPVLQADKPWEIVNYKVGISYFSVLRGADGKFRMWYGTGRLMEMGDTIEVGYAESDDGIQWVKPTGVWSRDNIVHRNAQGQGVFEDVQDPRAAHRFKMVCGSFNQPYTNIYLNHGLMMAHSADGRSWKSYRSSYFIGDCMTDTANSILWDPDLGAYRVLTRIEERPRGVKQFVIPWFDDALVGFGSEKPEWTVVQKERLPTEKGEIYCFYILKYWDLYLAYVSVFQDNNNRLFVAVSRNGVDWNYDLLKKGGEFLRAGPPGYFDEGCAFFPATSPLLTVGDKHWIYYLGSTTDHVVAPPADSAEPTQGAVGLAEIRLDGFFYLRVKGYGFVETKPFVWSGDRLEVNCSAGRGKLWVEVADERGNAVTNFSAGDADALSVDEVHAIVSWRRSEDAGALRGRVVRLRFICEGDVDLYAFQVLATNTEGEGQP